MTDRTRRLRTRILSQIRAAMRALARRVERWSGPHRIAESPVLDVRRWPGDAKAEVVWTYNHLPPWEISARVFGGIPGLEVGAIGADPYATSFAVEVVFAELPPTILRNGFPPKFFAARIANAVRALEAA